MTDQRRIYLDNAATSWPKPEGVYAAVEHYQRLLGAPAGRGVYREAAAVDDAVQSTRSSLAKLLDVPDPSRVTFAFSCTDAINLVLHGVLKLGDHVVTSTLEHNAVLRPLRWLEENRGVEVTRIACNESGFVAPEQFQAAVRSNTRLVVLSHASNVTGAIQPVAEVGRIAHRNGALFLVDAAQSLGHMPVSVEQLGADFLASSGHKGLLGPTGTGLLYVRPGCEEFLESLRQGGTGTQSEIDRQPAVLPEKYEAGTQNIPGIIGLGAGVSYLLERGLDDVRHHAIDLTSRLHKGLSGIAGVRVYGPTDAAAQIGIVTVNLDGYSPRDLATALDAGYRIQVRSGYHCAAQIHRTLGTFDSGGAVRFSIGPFNTTEDIDEAIHCFGEIAASGLPVPCPRPVGTCGVIREPSVGVTAAASPSNGETATATALDVTTIPGLKQLWGETLGDPRVCIAVLDGPVDLSHPSLAATNLAQIGLPASGVSLSGPAAAHGTHVASVIFGQHDSAVKGIAPQCRGLILPVFHDGEDGSVTPCSQIDLARAITQAIQFAEAENARALVINVSGGQITPSGKAHRILADVVRDSDKTKVLIVAAAGNEGCDCLHIPGAIPSVLAVGAMNPQGSPLDFSNWGETYRDQGVLALERTSLGHCRRAERRQTAGRALRHPLFRESLRCF